jgi:NADH:ubiquinone oxidoreductase subunit C
VEPLQIYERVKNRFGDRVLEVAAGKPDPFIVVDPRAIVEIGRYMRDDAELAIDPSVETLENVWKSANWMEREIYDLLGVTFEGHSDMRRILMPEDWIGHPLRKDFVEPMEYHGISTVRESPIIRLDTKKK